MKRAVSTSAFGLSLLLVVICLSPALFASVQGSFERSLRVTGAVDLEVLSRSGDITVRSGPAGTVKIIGKIVVSDRWFEGAKKDVVAGLEKNPPIRQSGNSIHIDYVNVRYISIDYEIEVPADTSLRTHSGSGDQTVEGLRATVNLESGSGDMRLTDLQGDVHTHTGSGNVTARGLSGPFDADAGSGDIRLEAKSAGDTRIHTGSGNIQIRGVKGGLRAEAGSGDIDAEGSVTDAWEIRTGSGNVEIHLAGNSGFDLEASTGSGRLVVDRPVTMTMQGDLDRSHHAISGRVNNGGPRLLVHTGSGDVHIG